MRIKRMTARFGKLAGETLNLSSGLNVIIAANEGGKTTWSGFIRTMLYGIDYDAVDKPGVISDRSRFSPWDGTPMEGEMVVSWGDETIVLQRSEKDSLPFAGFSASNELTGKEIQELFSLNCGESLVGASEDVFLRSAFIGHGGNLAVNSAPDLERRMAALVSSGQEDVSYAQVDEVLGSWLRRRQHGQNGMIPKLKAELEEARNNREKIGSTRETLNVLLKKEQELSRKIQALDDELEIYLKIEQRDINQRFVKAKQEMEEIETHHNNLLRQREKFQNIPSKSRLLDLEDTLEDVENMEPEIRQIEQAIRQVEDRLDDAQKRGEDDRFPDMSTAEATRQINTDMKEVEEIQNKLDRSRNNVWKSVLFGAVCGLGVAFGGFASPQHEVLFGLMGGAAFVGTTGISVMLGISTNRRRTARLDETFSFYRVAHLEEMRDVGHLYTAIQDEISTLTSQIAQSYQGLEDMRKKQRDTHKDFIEQVSAFAPDATNVKACADAISRALRLEEQMKKAEDVLEDKKKIYEALLEQGGEEYITLEELKEPETPRDNLEEKKAALDKEYEVLDRELHHILGQQEGLGDYVALTAREEAAEAELKRRQKELYAIAIARKGLERAYESVQHRFYPELNRLAGDYFSRLTGGRYSSLSLTRELEAFTMSGGEEAARNSMALSQGTVDQIYLAVRLAVADLCLAKGELCPIILDDALLSFDQVRMEFALDLLAEMGEKRQVILFSCHGREGKYLANHPKVKVTAI